MNAIQFSIFFLIGLAPAGYALGLTDPLERVEEDQLNQSRSSHDIFNRNLALASMQDYTDVSSYSRGGFGHYAHDVNVKTAWVLGEGQSDAMIVISLGLAVPINRVDVLEHRNENIRKLTLELYDGQSWESIEPLHPSLRNRFTFSRRSVSALRIQIETGGKSAGIAEVEVYDMQEVAPLPRYGSKELVEAMRKSMAVVLFDGSPYGYSRNGRELIKPRVAEAGLTDLWTQPVLEYISTSLGGQAAPAAPDELEIRLNKKIFKLDIGPEALDLEQIEALAEGAGLEYGRKGDLVMVGRGLEALSQDELISDLSELLGRNPYYLDETITGEVDAIVTPTLKQNGITYEWAGFRSSASPDTNSDAWLKYSETKVVRSWFNSSRYLSRYVKPPQRVTTEELFESFKREIRAMPETNDIIDTKAFMERYHEELYAEFSIYNRLGIEVINQTGPKDWPDTLHDDLIQWGATYSLTYYLAKNYGVAAHQFGNESDPYFNKSTEEQIARRLTLIADAVHAAIEDVNLNYKRNLRAIYSAPVLASDFQGRNARTMMRNLYTRYDGSKSPTRLFQLFNRHRYSGRPHQNALEVKQAKQMMQEEAGEVLPQVFTELNFSTGRNWARPSTTFTNDTPTVFTSNASIWGWMMQEQGVYGIFVFKLNDPRDLGPFSNKITYSIDPEQDPNTRTKELPQISYGTKNFEVSRLFGRGFHGSRPLLQTQIESSDLQYRSWTTVDEDKGRFYIWSVQANDHVAYELEFDLSRLNLPPNALITAEVVSGARHGEMTQVMMLPNNQKIRIQQASQSAMLLTIHKRPLIAKTFFPKADATIIQGKHSKENYGEEAWLEVGRHSSSDANKISFLTFELPQGEHPVQRAVLELNGQSQSTHAYDGGFLFRLYRLDSKNWQEGAITAENAPNVYRTVAALQQIDANNYPFGHVTTYSQSSALRVDVTEAVREAREKNQDKLSFVLIRELHWTGEATDFISAKLASREAGEERSPKLQVWE